MVGVTQCNSTDLVNVRMFVPVDVLLLPPLKQSVIWDWAASPH